LPASPRFVVTRITGLELLIPNRIVDKPSYKTEMDSIDSGSIEEISR